MRVDAEKFIETLEDAATLLQDAPAPVASISKTGSAASPDDANCFNLALFEDWSKNLELDFQPHSTIRTIHHQSCTGGTLISKCLASMPNVALLSEVNPLSQLHLSQRTPNKRPKFAPTDIIYMANTCNLPLAGELSEKIFKSDVEVVLKHVTSLGKYLVLREHSHSDFFVGKEPKSDCTLRSLLKDEYRFLSVATVRHPVDSYLSLQRAGWVHFLPSTFDEYCRRYLLFMACCENVPIFKYEDFVNDPDNVLKNICRALELPFNENFEDIFDVFKLSGDSGRTSNIIERKERRVVPESIQEELDDNSKYTELCELLGYER